jgi:hypothetical protein
VKLALLAFLVGCVDTSEPAPDPLSYCTDEPSLRERRTCACLALDVGDCYRLDADAVLVCRFAEHVAFPSDATFCTHADDPR